MGQIQNRVALCLTMDAVQLQPTAARQLVKNHLPRGSHRGQLRRIAKQDEAWKNLAQVIELPFVQHRGFVHKPHIQRLFAPFPALDEIASP